MVTYMITREECKPGTLIYWDSTCFGDSIEYVASIHSVNDEFIRGTSWIPYGIFLSGGEGVLHKDSSSKYSLRPGGLNNEYLKKIFLLKKNKRPKLLPSWLIKC